MHRIAAITVPVLVGAAFTPAATGATTNQLRGAPQMFLVSATTVHVHFTTDHRLKRKGRLRIAVSNAGTSRRAKPAGRHGLDFNYISVVRLHRQLELGRKYRVRFIVGHSDAIVRKVVLRRA